MANRAHKPQPWAEMATTLVDVATGRTPADLVVRNGRWVNVHSGEIIPGTDIAIVRRPLRLLRAGRQPCDRREHRRWSTPRGATWCRASATGTCMSKAAWSP